MGGCRRWSCSRGRHGRYLDLVVLHSNYWDVAQIVMFREDDRLEHAYGPLMKAWLANAEKVASFLRVIPSPATGTHPVSELCTKSL